MWFIVLCLVAFGLTRVFKYAKDNPGQTVQAASILKGWLNK